MEQPDPSPQLPNAIDDAERQQILRALNAMEEGSTLASADRIAGGLSGARVYRLHIRRGPNPAFPSIEGHRILKLAEVLHEDSDEKAAYDLCRRLAPGFMSRYAPELHPKSYHDRTESALLFSLANNKDTASTVSPGLADPTRLPELTPLVSTTMLDGAGTPDPTAFNRPWTPTDDEVPVSTVLTGWLGNRVDPASPRSARLRAVADKRSRLWNGIALQFGRNMFRDPLRLLTEAEFADHRTNRFYGLLHRDLHLGNILCKSAAGPRRQEDTRFWIIDFARASEGPLLFDHAYLFLSILCELDQSLTDAGLFSLLEGSADVDCPHSRTARTSLNGIVEAVESSAVKHTGYGMDILGQWHLALFAAGLDWAHKRFAPGRTHCAERAYLASAFAAQQYLQHYQLELRQPPDLAAAASQIARYQPRPETPASLAEPSIGPSGPGTQVSGLLLLNALLARQMRWEDLIEDLGPETLHKLQNGLAMSAAELLKVEKIAAKGDVFKIPGNFPAFMACSGSDQDPEGMEARKDLVGETESDTNKELRKLIADKKTFAAASWLESVRDDLLPSKLKMQKRSLRTWTLKKAYYHAGIRLSADKMADAAVADFSHKRWQDVINTSPSKGHRHLVAANQAIGAVLADKLLPKEPGRENVVTLVEGGVGGGHTTYFVLSEMERHAIRPTVKYMGMELVPALSEEMNAKLWNLQSGKEERQELFRRLRTTGKLQALRGDGRMVVTGRMEETVVDLWEELRSPEGAKGDIDAFFASFAFHHVPNGQAIIQFFANDAQGFPETLDRCEENDRKFIIEKLTEGCKALHEAYWQSDPDIKAIDALRRELLSGMSEGCPQAAVFLSLFDPGSVTAASLADFLDALNQRSSYPRNLLQRMLRNPQREVLLTVQSLLRHGGVLVIADPDGTSDFNADNAYDDKELTIANFLSCDELCAQLDELGFEGIEVRKLLKRRDGGFDAEPQLRHGPWEPSHLSEDNDHGYLVVARRDRCREREISAHNRRNLNAEDPRHLVKSDSERAESRARLLKKVASLGEFLKGGRPGVNSLIRNIFTPPDPVPQSGRLFRAHPVLRRSLLQLKWIRNLPGAAVIATRRIHLIPASASGPAFITTDFPETPQEIRENVARVFSHSDEANVLIERIKRLVERRRIPANAKVLDLCCGAGTLGIVSAILVPDATVTCVDSVPRAVFQSEINRVLNGIPAGRLHSIESDLRSFSTDTRFDLILADPPFSLRPPFEELAGRADDGGQYGDELSQEVLTSAPKWLSPDGKLLILVYSLVEKDENKRFVKLKLKKPAALVGDDFQTVESGYVWRFRHDKIANNQADFGLRLPFLAIRLADPTRPECITFQSPEEQRKGFERYTNWILDLEKEYKGLKYLMGEFTLPR